MTGKCKIINKCMKMDRLIGNDLCYPYTNDDLNDFKYTIKMKLHGRKGREHWGIVTGNNAEINTICKMLYQTIYADGIINEANYGHYWLYNKLCITVKCPCIIKRNLQGQKENTLFNCSKYILIDDIINSHPICLEKDKLIMLKNKLIEHTRLHYLYISGTYCPNIKCTKYGSLIELDPKIENEKFIFYENNPLSYINISPIMLKQIEYMKSIGHKSPCIYVCSYCSISWCTKCLVAGAYQNINQSYHYGESCNHYRLKHTLTVQILNSRTKDGVATCPECFVEICKDNGACDHMVCSMCNTDFCFVCEGNGKKLFNIDKNVPYRHHFINTFDEWPCCPLRKDRNMNSRIDAIIDENINHKQLLYDKYPILNLNNGIIEMVIEELLFQKQNDILQILYNINDELCLNDLQINELVIDILNILNK